MQRKPLFWFLLSLLCLAGSAYFWSVGDHVRENRAAAKAAATSATNTPSTASPSRAVLPALPATNATQVVASQKDEKSLYPYRLHNSTVAYDQLLKNPKAVLLMNAALDSSKPLDYSIPAELRARPDNGSYLVQSKTDLNGEFRQLLQSSHATIVSYIPNNAYLVRASADSANQLAASPLVQSVLNFEPYFKLEPTLLKQVMETTPPSYGNTLVNVLMFGGNSGGTLQELRQFGSVPSATQQTPFGPMVQMAVSNDDLTKVAQIPGVQALSASHRRVSANDLMRMRLGISTNSALSNTPYLGLTGKGVLLNVNDTGVDITHPDLAGRVTLDPSSPALSLDTEGHGTHVIGTILGNGSQSGGTNTYAQGSTTNAGFQGMAPDAKAYVQNFTDYYGDPYLQLGAASYQETNAMNQAMLISNDSWNYYQDFSYDIAAASYDAAVRDADPYTPGSQAICYVFSAGNDGYGNTDGSGGSLDSIDSPATAKNVITVGALEQPRYLEITNTYSYVTNVGTNMMTVTTNEIEDYYLDQTDSSNQVAYFSSRGNVGIATEGTYGRFKPDLVAPGSFVVSCRSTNWSKNPFAQSYSYSGQVTNTNLYYLNELFTLNSNVTQVQVKVLPNGLTTGTLPAMPIYGSDGRPTTNDLLGNGSVTLPNANYTLNPNATLQFAVGNPSPSNTYNFNVVVTITLNADTNASNPLVVLSNLDDELGPFYRYESGTSMAAAGVSGTLACMQQFFQDRKLGCSPALMKALLINSARSVGALYKYNLNDQYGNYQGWGIPNISNAIPAALTNLPSAGISTLPLIFVDQSPTNALATGQSLTWNLNLSPAAVAQGLRATLVWTDPPGNPSAGPKLVNDLDLIITNLNTGDVYYGNDIPAGTVYNEFVDTNAAPIADSINNVENIFLKPSSVTSNYSITVLARRVNVNALTVNTNNVVQDFALVISSGTAGSVSNPFTAFTPATSTVVTNNNLVTNLLAVTDGQALPNQRIGANSQFSGSTNGTRSQWNFYIFTNTVALTNSAFKYLAFNVYSTLALSSPRPETFQELDPATQYATRNLSSVQYADVDLYVSTDPGLTNLNPAVIANSWANGLVSASRGGDEAVLLTNNSGSPGGQVYYIGVKSEDQQGAQYQLLAYATDQPFNLTDSNGNYLVVSRQIQPTNIPGGSSAIVSNSIWIGNYQATDPTTKIRYVIASNTITAQNSGDLIGRLIHGDSKGTSVLNNHTYFPNPVNNVQSTIYDDSGANTIPNSRHTDGPGDLLSSFANQSPGTQWQFTMVNDNSLTDTGAINSFQLTILPHVRTNNFSFIIQPNSWYYDFVDINAEATNLTITLSNLTEVLYLYVKEGSYPTQTNYDYFEVIHPPGGSLSINKRTLPPLNQGTYYYGIYNPNQSPASGSGHVEVDYGLNGPQLSDYFATNPVVIADDSVTYSPNIVSDSSTVLGAEVGVRIQHSRESDLVLTLISPSGTRVLLAENRGELDNHGYGSGTSSVAAFTTNGTYLPTTNTIPLTSTSGTASFNYSFLTIPDDLRVYYGNNLLWDTGLVSGSGGFSVSYSGSLSNLTTVMNQAGTNPKATNGDYWSYSVALQSADVTYAIFSEDTNFATTPIKFAVPPFAAGPALIPPTNILTTSFDLVVPNVYSNGVVDGWSTVGTNAVTVVNVPNLALSNSVPNVVALHQSGLTRILPTVEGVSYTLSFAAHGLPVYNPSSWWRAESNFLDSAGNNKGFGNNTTFTNGVVSNAFAFNGSNAFVRISTDPTLNPSTGFTIEGWIYFTGTTNPLSSIFSKWGDAGTFVNQQSYTFEVLPTGALEFGIADSTNQGPTPLMHFDSPVSTIPLNTWTHVAAVYDTNSGTRSIYANGVLVASTNNTPITNVFAGTADACIGARLSDMNVPVDFFPGFIDELSFYSTALNATQIQDIYAAGSAGKRGNQPNLNAVVGTFTNTIPLKDGWTGTNYTFVAPLTDMPVSFIPASNPDGTPMDGILVDAISLTENARPNAANYFLPEESLNKIIGEPSKGTWNLEVVDNRVGPAGGSTTNVLVDWLLRLKLADTQPGALTLQPQVTYTNSVDAYSLTYFRVDVPVWAQMATNLLINATGPVNLLYDQYGLPSDTNAPDYLLINNATSGSSVLTIASAPTNIVPGNSYYLAVQNNGATAVNFSIEVDFDIPTLLNGVPFTTNINTGIIPNYYQFDVPTNQTLGDFYIFPNSGNLQLIASQGAPLPSVLSYNYSVSTAPLNILLFTNSTPVGLSPGRWYIGVINNDTNVLNYTIEAQAANPIPIVLPDGVAITNTIPPGPDISEYYVYTNSLTNSSALLFQAYGLSGDVDLQLGQGSIPYPFQGYFVQSANPGLLPESIVLRTNLATNISTVSLPDLTGGWYLSVPNNTLSNVTYTIRGVVSTNGVLPGGIPFHVTESFTKGSTNGPTLAWQTIPGNCYDIQTATNLLTGFTTLTNILATTDNTTNNILTFTDPSGTTNNVSLFYRIVLGPCGP